MPTPKTSRCFVLIASGKDKNYLKKGTLIAIRSIRETNPGIPIVILHHDLSLKQQSLFSGTILKQIDPREFNLSSYSKSTRSDIPETVFLSLFVEYIEDFDIAIYIDADAVVLESLDDLFNMKMPLVARVTDDLLLSDHFENGEQLLIKENIKAKFAFNNGVVRFDLQFWRTNSLLRNAISLFEKHGPQAFNLSDQSLLNLVAYKTKTLTAMSRIYNFRRYPDMLQMEHSLANNHLGLTAPRIPEGLVKVVHWNGPLKPWNRGVKRIDNFRVALCLDCYEQFDK